MKVSIFLPGFYRDTIYALSLIPAQEIYIYFPDTSLISEIEKQRKNEVDQIQNVKLNPLKIDLFKFDFIKIIKHGFSINSLFKFKIDDNIVRDSDIIITSELHTRYSYQIAKLARKYEKNFIALSENDPSLSVTKLLPYSFYKKYVARYIKAAGSATVLSDIYLKSLNVSNIFRIYVTAVNIELFKPIEKNTDKIKKILFVGVLERYKGFHTLIKALNLISEKYRFELIVIGKGSLKYLLTDSKFKFEYHEFLQTEELIKKYQTSDIFVMPSETQYFYGLKIWTEVFGLAYLEAMSTGLATIASNCGNLPYITQNKNLIFKEGDYLELAKKIEMILNNEDILINVGIKNRKFIEKKFNTEEIKNEWRKIL